MPSVELTDQEWQQVLTWIGTRIVWAECNGMLMKIGQQLTQQAAIKQTGLTPPSAEELKRMGGVSLDANGKEVRHGE
jgi:hypothetical protein